MRSRKGSYEMDMTSGPILPKVLLFSVPLMLSSVLQLLFNAADLVVVGRFAADGSSAQAAVGSTGALINLIINLFLGLSIGTNVAVARYYGAGQHKDASESVNTSITISFVGGLILAVFGFLFAETFLEWMGSPNDVRPLATVYVKIYFIGMPFNILYNFGSAVLRAVGDTRRPLIFLAIAGVTNVILNIFFVAGLGMDVDGVALATIISQAISAVLVLLCLMRAQTSIHFDIRKMHLYKDKLIELARIGLPAGLQGTLFSLSNVLIQSTINSFGKIEIAGSAVSSNIEGFLYVSMNSIYQAAITFTSQNVGAHQYRRIRKICFTTVMVVSAIGLVLGGIAMLFRHQLISIYNQDPAVMKRAVVRLEIFAATYFTCGIMDVLCGMLRGLGSTIIPMIVSLLGACAFRIFWIYCILPFDRTPFMLYFSYPVSWVLTSAIHFLCYLHLLKRFPVEPEKLSAVKA